MSSLPSAHPPGQGRRRRVIRNIAYLVTGTGGASLLALGAVAINSRALSLADFGAVVLLQSSAMLIAGIFGIFTQQAVIKLGMAAIEQGDSLRFERLIGMSLAADLLSAVVASGAAMAAVLLLPGLTGLPADRVLPACIVAGSLLLQGYRTSEGVFRVFDRFDLMGLIQLACAGIQLAIAAALYWIDAPFAAYAGLVAVAIALPSVVQMAIAVALLRRRGLRPRFGGIAAANADRREFVAYCWTTSITSTCDTIRQNGDSPLVGALISVEAAGIYNVAKQLSGIIRKGTSIYASVLFPELAAMAARRDIAGARRIMGKAVWASMSVIVLVVAASGVAGGLALNVLFGPAFAVGHLALVILCAAAGVQMLGASYSLYVQSFIGPVPLLRSYLVATAAFLALSWPALALLGLPGAAVGQVVFSVALALACRIQLRRQGILGERRT